jgi:hypothetical protein
MPRPLFTPAFDGARMLPSVNPLLLADLPRYPGNFPVPDREPYSYAVDMGVVRSEMAAGNSRQRRAYKVMPHYLSLSFHMRIEELYLWQNWIDAFGYEWFVCPVSTMYAGGPPVPANLRDEVLRFTSDLAIGMEGWDWVSVTVAAELSGDAQASNIGYGTHGWVIGGTPADPSVDWIIGGTPAAPSPDWVIAGTATFPASLL